MDHHAEKGLPLRTFAPVVELRQYTHYRGQRDVLIDLFEREFVDALEATGMSVIGQFRDLDNPDRFVWMRGFADMRSRAEALTAFYGGPVWAVHRDAANATLIDTDNVLLLRPARPGSGFLLHPGRPDPAGSSQASDGIVIATICSLTAPAAAGLVDIVESALAPALTGSGASILASFVTEESENSYPRLPVREGEHVVVWFARVPSRAAGDEYVVALAESPRWQGAVADPWSRRLTGPPEVMRLEPTPRSRLRA